MTILLTEFNVQNHPWLQDASLRRILDIIKTSGGEARPVGGAVRDALLGRAVGEIDIAVNLEPQKVTDVLTSADIKVIPTGIDYGTVTAVVDKKPFELTSLRRDIETDGRYAKVVYTQDWQEDAARRDFTFNALYVNADGKIFDYFDGLKDLARGHVRFIGEARERIQEDVLRILRFFRFYAWFGKGDPDHDGLQACCQMASLLPQLSVERVWREIVKLLAADNPLPTWKLMQGNYILAQLLPEADNLERLQNLLEVEQKYEVPSAPLLRMAALLPKSAVAVEHVARRLKLSNHETDILKKAAEVPGMLKGKLDPVPLRRMLYNYDSETIRNAALLLASEQIKLDLEPVLAMIAAWEKPVFPVQGEDVLKLGIKAGPQVGVILRAVEEWWLNQDFRPSRDECMAALQQHVTR